jgi:hypothetical protein
LTKNCAQTIGEADVGQLVDLALVDVFEGVLDRIFDGHDVPDLLVELVNGRVERCRLAAASRPGDNDHSVGRVQHAVEFFVRRARETQLLQSDKRPASI